MVIVHLVTHNKYKVKEFKHVLEPEIAVEHINTEYDEIRADTNEEISLDAAKKVAEQFQKPVIVEDSGVFITALQGFPGTYSGYIYKCIGLNGILRIMQDHNNRECFYKSAIGYCVPGEEPVVFLGQERGTLATEIRGDKGFGHDPIFIPEGYDKTYAEMDDVLDLKKFRKIAIEQLRNHILSQKIEVHQK